MSSLIGRTLGRYRILSELGRDASGRVYQAEDTIAHEMVRLWVASESLVAHDPSLKRRLAQAVDQAANLISPQIMRPRAPEEIDGQLCLASPYVEGKTLREELQGQALAWERARRIAADLAHAWGAAHQQGLSLTGLSPDSVIVTADGHALLSELALLPLPRPLVQVGSRMVAGTPAYLAPEVARGEPPTPASAVYALGMLLYEMLAGHPAFHGNDSEVILAHMNQEPPPLPQAGRRPRLADEVLARCLAKDPGQRYPTPAELAAALSSAAAPSPKLSRLPKRALPVAVVALALVALAAFGWRTFSNRADSREQASPTPAYASAQTGTYEVTLPKRLRPGESAQVRLAIHLPEGASAEELPAAPPETAQAADAQLLGAIPLCQQLWARLEAPTLKVLEPNTVRRTLRPPCAEWLWDIACETATSGTHPAKLQVFVRQAGPDGVIEDIPVKELAFEIEVAAAGHDLPAGALGGLAVAIIAVVAILLLARRGRRNTTSM